MNIRLAVAGLSLAGLVHAQGADAVRIQRDIAKLASDKWEGRATCSPGLDSAAAYIAARFHSLGLVPAGTEGTNGTKEFFHRYVARPSGHTGTLVSCSSQNVAAIVPGSDATLADEYIVVGAHYDHLGRDPQHAVDRNAGTQIRNGADDNASGTAGVMELARLFKAHPAKRSIIFVTFSGEEWGLLGSDEFAKHGLPVNRVQAMVNFDMIGRMKGDTVIVFGSGSAAELAGILREANRGRSPLTVRTNPGGFGQSDQNSFYLESLKRDIPVLHFFTGTHDDYHKATDDAAKINSLGEARLLDFAERVIRDVAAAAPLTFAERPTQAPSPGGSGSRAYLGSIPDMAAGDIPGLRVNDVTRGSPADKGGMKSGDVVVELAGKPVTDIESYSAALYANKPGDSVKIVVVRGGQRVTLTVVLATRQ